MDRKTAKIRDLKKEKQTAEKRGEEEVNAIRDELDLAKEKII